jgi:hypothetical protein
MEAIHRTFLSPFILLDPIPSRPDPEPEPALPRTGQR